MWPNVLRPEGGASDGDLIKLQTSLCDQWTAGRHSLHL